MRECEKCGSYNTYELEVVYGLGVMALKLICSDCGHEEYLSIDDEE